MVTSDPDPDPDKAAIALLRRRDPAGFDLAYRTYAPRLRSFLLRLTRRQDVADDMLQHTFLRLAERGPNLRPDSNLRAWLFTVARNATVSLMRSTPPSSEDSALEVVAATPPDVEARLLLGDVELALSRLRRDDREVLLLVGGEQLDQETVARLLGIEAAALRQRLARARSRLLVELAGLESHLGAQRK